MTPQDIGGRVRQAREQRGLSLGDAARLTKLSTSVLRAIERNDFASLPAGMYRKAYLRTVAAEVGLNPLELAADYETHYEPPVESATATKEAFTVSDRWIEELRPSRRPTIVTLTAFVTLSVAWFAIQPDRSPVSYRRGTIDSESESPGRTAVHALRAVAPDVQSASPRAAAAITAPKIPLKIDLTMTDWCWVAAASDGKRVVYGLIGPGKRVVVEGRHRISLRLGDAGSVQLSINDGPSRTAGTDGEVVELEVTSDAVQTLDDALETES